MGANENKKDSWPKAYRTSRKRCGALIGSGRQVGGQKELLQPPLNWVSCHRGTAIACLHWRKVLLTKEEKRKKI